VKLRNEFVVPASVEQTWRTLLDVPRVASALPGATIEPGGDGDYRGRMTVKVGPVTVEYAGTARLEEVDEEQHVASFYVQGSGGQGSAAASIVNRLAAEDDGRTRVVVETDLRVTGRAAAFGRGLLEDVSARMLAEFARRLEAELTEPGSEPGTESAARVRARSEPGSEPGAERLDLGAAAWEPLVRRYALPALVVLLLLSLLRRPKVIVIHK
jgi:carbon monoxide dehydrogenase subunit G